MDRNKMDRNYIASELTRVAKEVLTAGSGGRIVDYIEEGGFFDIEMLASDIQRGTGGLAQDGGDEFYIGLGEFDSEDYGKITASVYVDYIVPRLRGDEDAIANILNKKGIQFYAQLFIDSKDDGNLHDDSIGKKVFKGGDDIKKIASWMKSLKKEGFYYTQKFVG